MALVVIVLKDWVLQSELIVSLFGILVILSCCRRLFLKSLVGINIQIQSVSIVTVLFEVRFLGVKFLISIWRLFDRIEIFLLVVLFLGFRFRILGIR